MPDVFSLLSLMIVTAAVMAWVNARWVKLPTTIGVLVVALAMSLMLHVLEAVGLHVQGAVEVFVDRLDLGHTVLDVLLAFLLFAGALHINLGDLYEQRWIIGLLASAGVILTTGAVGGLLFGLCQVLDMDVPLLHCLVFGALIAPTDPIAVLGILKTANTPKSLDTKIAGESLFNDGFGLVSFTVLLAFATGGHDGGSLDATGIALLFGREIVGSLVLGLAAGWLAFRMMKAIDDYHVEVMITLALCMGVYSLAAALHMSGPIAVVVSGLLIGNTGRTHAMSAQVDQYVDTFWELLDEILNVVLFVLMGMEVLLIGFERQHVLMGLVAIPVVLLARYVSVGGMVSLLRHRRTFTRGAVTIMTWGGLRGGISIALALSLTLPDRSLFLTMTYVVVVFSIVVQGLTVGPLVRRVTRTPPDRPAPPDEGEPAPVAPES